MITRRRFLATSASALAATSTLGSAAESADKKSAPPLFSFGLMADCQYADADSRGVRHYRESPKKLSEAVDAFNGRELAFTFHLGDFIDRDIKSFDVLEPIVSKLNSKLHHALGNHDFDVADDLKAGIPAKLGLEKGHYSFRHEGFRFIVIDTTDVSTYRYPKGSDAQLACAEAMKEAAAAGSKGAQSYNGQPGEEQIAWLEAELVAAAGEKETALVLGHHPILPDAAHSIWNAQAMNAVLQKHPAAKIYINGHNHAGAYTDADGLHYLTLDGMLDTKDQNAYAFADLYADRLEITGFGRQENHILKFR